MVVDHLDSMQIEDHFHSIELILGCGDWLCQYLEFLVASLNVSLLYLPGHCDPAKDRKY
jgi:hypothetical protein